MDPEHPYDPAPEPGDLLNPFDSVRLRQRLHEALDGVLDQVFVAGCDDLDGEIAQLKSERPDYPRVTATNEFLIVRARRYLELGPKAYHRADPWQMPPSNWTPRMLAGVHEGMLQLTRRRGLSRERPFEGLSLGDLFRTFAVLHHHVDRYWMQQAPDGRTLERLSVLHATTGNGGSIWALITGQA
jgi:hypothetical protein